MTPLLTRSPILPLFRLDVVALDSSGRNAVWAVGLLLFALFAPRVSAAVGELELRVIDPQTEKPVTVRMHLWNAKGVPRKVRGQPNFNDHFVFHGRVVLRLPPGEYRFRIERGLEYLEQSGNFLIRSGARDHKSLEMSRFVNMRDLGWLSADLFVRRPASHYPAWAASEDLNVLLPMEPFAVDKTSGARQSQPSPVTVLPAPLWDGYRHQLAVCNVDRAPDSEFLTSSFSSSGRLLKFARGQRDAVCVAADVRAIDLPMWVASQRLDAVVTMRPAEKSLDVSEAVLPQDVSRFPGQRGLARFREHLYFQLLECGIQLTPLACSCSGDADVPLGSLRTYAWTGPSPDEAVKDVADAWWQAVRDGRVVLTGGPVMLVQANGHPPGWVFQPASQSKFQLEFSATLHTRERISYLEIVQNGAVVQTVSLDDWVEAQGKLPKITFDQSGWALLRAVIDADDDYRYAVSGPFYVQCDGKPRVSREAVSFFQSWANKRRDALKPQSAAGELAFHRRAVEFWQERAAEANTD